MTIYLTLLSSVLLVSGCIKLSAPEFALTDTQQVASRSPLVTEPCAPPCWQNITPGISTRDDAYRIFAETPGIAFNCTNIDEPPFVGIECDGARVWFHEDSNKVEFITLFPTQLVTLAQIVDRYGEPDLIGIDSNSGVPEHPRSVIAIYYAAQGLSTTLANPEEVITYKVEPGMTVSQLTYKKSQDLEELTQQLGSRGGNPSLMPWYGFGDYEQYLSGE